LLLAGSIADAVGSRPVYLVGTLFLGVFVLASGLAQTGIQLIMFRAMQGIGTALCMPTSISILTTAIPEGKTRNFGFSCLGMAQVLGFASGLVISGVMSDTIGWRAGWYICGGTTLVLLLVGVWSVPSDSQPRSLKKLKTDVDWVGAILATGSLTMLAYTLV
jgi:MFS family permease